MNLFSTLFWIGFLVLIAIHVLSLLRVQVPMHAVLALVATSFMFVGSKIGREFLGIKT